MGTLTKNSVKVDDKKWRKILAVVGKKYRVQVGIPSGIPSENSNLTLAEIGACHEFGTKTIPERSWLRATFEKKEQQLIALQGTLFKKILTEDLPAEQAMEILGMWGAEETKKTIIDQHIPPPLAESTIRRKGDDHPLIHHGHMVNAITYEVLESKK